MCSSWALVAVETVSATKLEKCIVRSSEGVGMVHRARGSPSKIGLCSLERIQVKILLYREQKWLKNPGTRAVGWHGHCTSLHWELLFGVSQVIPIFQLSLASPEVCTSTLSRSSGAEASLLSHDSVWERGGGTVSLAVKRSFPHF